MATEDTDSFEELDDVSDTDSDFVVTKRRKRAVPRLQPPKRPRPKAALRVTSSPRAVRTVNERSEGISAGNIYDAVRSGKSAMVAVVDEWLDTYKQSQEVGLLVLINFIVQSCGCKGVVNRKMLDSMQNADLINTLTKQFDEDSGHYPLWSQDSQLKHFKAGLCEFAQVLVRSCQNSIIYDEYLFSSLFALLTGLSDSQVRAFRHTSTFLAMKLMTGLVEVAVAVSVQLQTTQRRCDTESRKGAHDRSSDRLEELQATINELCEKRAELMSMMNANFRGVFVHRYRDLIPEIRMICIEELGKWLKNDPEHFLNDGCLKYLGWTLHDKQGPVRMQCVRALQGLYQEKQFIGRLELFTSRFKERMLSMVLDKDPDVAVEVVKLLLLIQEGTEGGLREEECGHIYHLVYAVHRGLAAAAGAFLYNKVKNLISSEKEESVTAAFFEILIHFYSQNEFHEHGAYLVDSLWDVAGSELRDWETMTALLLQESGLTYEEEGALIELMMCAIRQAVQATPAGRVRGRRSVKDKKIQEQDRRRITTHFIPLLPPLLAKYSADAGKVSRLLKAPLYFNLEMYNSAQWLEKHLDQLLSQVCGIVEKHTEATVLKACTHLASALCSNSYTFSSRAHLAFSQLMDDLTECFGTYIGDLVQGTIDDNDMYTAATALKRIAALSIAKDPTGWKLFDSCLKLLRSGVESSELHKELMVPALRCAASHLMWAKVNAVNSKPAEAELTRLKKDVHVFCRVAQACLSLNQHEIRDEAFELLCDLLLLYSTSSVRTKPALQTLVHIPSDSMCFELAAFLLDYIFTDSEDAEISDDEEVKLTLLQKKRNHLAGYCKLVLYGVLDLSAATNVFKHYSKYFKDFGDIIKETINRSKIINPVQSAKTVCLSLQQLFSEMLMEDHSRQNLSEIRDLAKRLALSFSIDLHASKPLVALHMDGIRFSFQEPQEGEEGEGQLPNVAFLEILSEFSFKLGQQDRTHIAALLKSECPSAALSRPSVRMYQQSLETRSFSRIREQEAGGDATSPRVAAVAKRKRTSTRKAKTSRGSSFDSSSIHYSLLTPALTSTVEKQPDKQPASRKHAVTEPDIGSDLMERQSEDEFCLGKPLRKVKRMKRRQLSSRQTGPSLEQQDLNSHFTLLSLFEEGTSEREEDDMEDYQSELDHESAYALPSTRHTSILDELFD